MIKKRNIGNLVGYFSLMISKTTTINSGNSFPSNANFILLKGFRFSLLAIKNCKRLGHELRETKFNQLWVINYLTDTNGTRRYMIKKNFNF